MKLFDTLVAQALKNNTDIAILQPVVEKELLHHDILREMNTAGLLEQLTFIGGTCLRACYGSNRLSEDLDFTGGTNFTSEMLQSLGATLQSRLFTKYGLDVTVSEPKKEIGNVSTSHRETFLLAAKANINIAFSSAAFEFWILLLLRFTTKGFVKSEEIISEIEKNFPYTKKTAASILAPGTT